MISSLSALFNGFILFVIVSGIIERIFLSLYEDGFDLFVEQKFQIIIAWKTKKWEEREKY